MPREPLEAILLVGGQGTRLRPLTLSAPKPLLPTAGVPFLAHLLARAAAGGVTHVVLATCYKADMFAACLGDGSAFGLSIDYVTEDVPLDTAGGIRNAAPFAARHAAPSDPVVVFNSDVLSGHDLGAQVDLHGKTDAAVTLHLVEVADPSRFGVRADRRDRARDRVPGEDAGPGDQPDQRRLLRVPARGHRPDPGRAPGFGRAGDVPGTDRGGRARHGLPRVGVLAGRRDAADVRSRLVRPGARAAARARPGPGPAGPSLVLAGASVAADASVAGGTVVGAGASVGAGATVFGSVLFDGASVGEGAVVRDSIVGRGAVVAPGAVLDGAVVGDGAFIGPGNELARGIRIWPGVRLEPTSIRFSSDV